MPFDPDTRDVADQLRSMLAEVLKRPDLPALQDLTIASADVLAIVKGMIDGAGERGELDQRALHERVARAVFGYLGS